MSRSTKALKRFGVPSLAAVTMVAGLPLFLGTASAAHIQGLTLSPDASTDNAGTCVPYTVQLNFTTPQQAQAETVDVTLTEGTANASVDVDFCTAPTGTQQPATPTETGTDGGAAGTEDRAEFRTDANGFVTFGVISNGAASGNTTVNIRAFYETTDNDVFNAGEFQDNSVQTFVGTSDGNGVNSTQDRAEFVEVVDRGEPTPATATVTADADTDLAIETETRTYRVFVGTNASGNANSRLAGVVVSYRIDSTVNSADVSSTMTFGTTDNNGIATGTITFPARTEATNTTQSTDEVTFFVNQSGLTSTPGLDVGEPSDELVVTVRQDAQQANRTVTLFPLTESDAANFYSTSGDAAVNPANDGNRTFRAVVDAADGQPSTASTELAFSVSGGSGDETVTPFETATSDFTASTGTDNNDSFVDVVVNDPTPLVGQTLTVTATVRGTSQADTATLTFRNRPGDARFIDLTPATSNSPTNSAQQLQARVTDVDGNPVRGVLVTFTETGAGAFRNGNSSAQDTTDANGIARAEVIALPNENGTQTVTATISAGDTQCDELAGAGTDPQGNNLTATSNPGTEAAGDCDDTATVNFGTAASPSPSATSTATTSPSPGPSQSQAPGCATADVARTRVITTTISAGARGIVEVDAPANSVVQLFAYSRPSTTYRLVRQAESASGSVRFDNLTPPTNTRFQARVVKNGVGCAFGESVVMNVRTTISLLAKRIGVRTYVFSGDSLPARPGGLIVSLYRVTNDGRQILTAQTRANASNGEYSITRRFTGSGRFGFVVRTGQDLQNAPGSSNVRSLAVF